MQVGCSNIPGVDQQRRTTCHNAYLVCGACQLISFLDVCLRLMTELCQVFRSATIKALMLSIQLTLGVGVL